VFIELDYRVRCQDVLERFGLLVVFLTRGKKRNRFKVGLYTMMPSPIVYGVCHAKGGSVGGGVYCAMVVQ